MNGNDFLKSCTTNVLVVNELFETQYTVYVSPKAGEGLNDPYAALADLRRHDVLCAVALEELWVFGTLEPELKQLLETQRYVFGTSDGGFIGSNTTKEAAGGNNVKEVLLEAIEGSIAYSLADGHGIIHAGRFTWLFKASEDTENELDGVGVGVLVKVHVNLTDAGTLYLSTTTHSCHLRSLNHHLPAPNTDIVLAPSGQTAKLSASRELVNYLKPFNTAWQSKVSRVMLAEGITLGGDDEWVALELSDTLAPRRFIWPAHLCLVADAQSCNTSMLPSVDGKDWTQWFRNADDTDNAFKDPLTEAEDWFTGTSKRESAVRAALEGTAATSLDTVNTATTVVAETPVAASPPFNQRLVDQQLTLAGIYPTPPDGLIPGQAAQHPSSDGAGGAMQIDQNGFNIELQLPGSDDDQARGDSVGPSGEAQAFHPNSDDLFGDIGEIEFGANEIGEADFDYFDEPDELPQDAAATQDVEFGDGAAHVEQDEVHTCIEPEHGASIEKQLIMREDKVASSDNPLASPHDDLDFATASERGDVQTKEILESPDQDAAAQETLIRKPEKPLSPFSIRERLLPPPIPASAISADGMSSLYHRRSSAFEPISFNENLDLTSKYINKIKIDLKPNMMSQPKNAPVISLTVGQKQKRPYPPNDPDSGVTDMNMSSDDDSYDSMSSVSDDRELPPKVPWDTRTRKRKRTSAQDQLTLLPGGDDCMWYNEEPETANGQNLDIENVDELLHLLLTTKSYTSNSVAGITPQGNASETIPTSLPDIEEFFEVSKLDLVYVAQIIGEQAVSAIPSILSSTNSTLSTSRSYDGPTKSAIQSLVEQAVASVPLDLEDCGLSRLAVVKEPPQRPMSNPGKAPQMGHPRLPQREGSMQLGPDYFPIPPPFVRIQRGIDMWEMLPPALNFWDALGLGPANGRKDVRVINVVPGNVGLVDSSQQFVKELGNVYESHKLGSFTTASNVDSALEELDSYEDGVIFVGVDEEPVSITSALRVYADACTDLGAALAKSAHLEPDRTIVVFMVDPFEDERVKHYLCACFWVLCQAYRQHVPKAYMKSPRSDVVLQIIPVSLVASTDTLVVLDAQQMGVLATELYGRCPPSSKATVPVDLTSALPIPAAPAVELTTAPPKRIGFQLLPDPLNDLLHEGSVLHLAYALSKDGQWMSASWIDSTGRYQMTSAACLRGKSFYDVANEVWERTMDIIMARDVTWRIFVVSNVEVDASMLNCWRTLAASKTRRQMLHVTLLSVQTESSLQLTPPPPLEDATAFYHTSGQPTGLLTPGSPSQSTNRTVSPDASGQTNNAPITPASSDIAGAISENDPDAHLVDVTDESWAMLLAPAFTASEVSTLASTDNTAMPSHTTSAGGILFKRGNLQSLDSDRHLDSLGVSLHWDIRVRPSGMVDDGPVKQAEATLREVLKMYRNLGLLTRLRHLDISDGVVGAANGRGSSGMLPVHVATAVKTADALNGLLP